MRKKLCESESRRIRKERNIIGPAVDVEGIASAFLLQVMRKSPWRWGRGRGLLRRDLGELWVNADESPQAQRFSIGHELGHCVLHPDVHVFSEHADPDSAEYADDPEKELENEADYFSSVLLVPPEWLKQDVEGGATPGDLSIRYDVSPSVIFIALQQHRLLMRVRSRRR